jgi:hypothetical protein
MNSEISAGFKRFFLLEFTKELIRHSEKRDILKLQNIIIAKEKAPIQPATPPSIQTLEPTQKPIVKLSAPVQVFQSKATIKNAPRKNIQKRLFIPEPKFPQHLSYLSPLPSQKIDIDLWKLNPLIKDPAVRVIEANPDEKIIVSGTMGTKPTAIVLSREDIDRVIEKFSEISKIPANEGVYRVIVGNLILAAIVSKVVGSRFIIRKMAFQLPSSIQNQSFRT